MYNNKFKKDLRNWLILLRHTTKRNERLCSLKSRAFTLNNTLFIEMVQEPNMYTESFFRKKKAVSVDFIVPQQEEWGVKYPCSVTMYRNAREDIWSDQIYNWGDDNDIKTYPCQISKAPVGKPCNNPDCQYCNRNHELYELPSKISIAEYKLQKTKEQRKAAWKQIWTRGK